MFKSTDNLFLSKFQYQIFWQRLYEPLATATVISTNNLPFAKFFTAYEPTHYNVVSFDTF